MACEGANSAVEELLGLIRDFDEEVSLRRMRHKLYLVLISGVYE